MRYKEVMRVIAIAGLSLLALSSPLLLCSAAGKQAVAANILPQAADPSNGTRPVLLTAAQLENLLPATVYFRGRTASLQLRNAAGVRFGSEGYFLAAMVDTSGYASNLQEKYQMYVITESALTIAGQNLNPGAYGAGMVNGKFMVMDVGGHTLLQADASVDTSMARPRPLQLLATSTGGFRLYLGRNWITVSANDRP